MSRKYLRLKMFRPRPSRFHVMAVNDEEEDTTGDDDIAPTFDVELSGPGSLNDEKGLIQKYQG